MVVREYTIFPIGNPSRNWGYIVCGWRIHKLIVGEYTVFPIGNPLRKSRIHSFLVENTQVDCRRMHSFHYRKTIKELENTQSLVENTQVDCWRIHSFSYRKSLKELENTQFLGGEYTS